MSDFHARANILSVSIFIYKCVCVYVCVCACVCHLVNKKGHYLLSIPVFIGAHPFQKYVDCWNVTLISGTEQRVVKIPGQ